MNAVVCEYCDSKECGIIRPFGINYGVIGLLCNPCMTEFIKSVPKEKADELDEVLKLIRNLSKNSSDNFLSGEYVHLFISASIEFRNLYLNFLKTKVQNEHAKQF